MSDEQTPAGMPATPAVSETPAAPAPEANEPVETSTPAENPAA